jgi:hypothetical protein
MISQSRFEYRIHRQSLSTLLITQFTMAILPNELLSEVCSHADIRTLKQLRLVDRTMNDFAAKFLFQEVYLILLPESIENVRQLIRHPVYKHYVRCLRYFADRLSPVLEEFEWEAWKTTVIHDSGHVGSADSDSKIGWYRFCRLRSEQSFLVDEEAELNILYGAFCGLVNIDSLYVVNTHQVLYCSEEYQTSPYHQIAEETALNMSDAFCPASIDSTMTPSTSAHVSVLSALDSSEKRLKSLQFVGMPSIFWVGIQNFAFYTAIETCLNTAFSSLRSLELSTKIHRMQNIEDSSGETRSLLCHFLSHAPLLESFCLQFFSHQPHTSVGHTYAVECQTDITDVFEKLSWHHLRELSLNNVSCETDIFVKFVKLHSETLEKFGLYNVKLVDAPRHTDITDQTDNSQTLETTSAWEYAVWYLALYLDLEDSHLETCTDDYLVERMKEGDINGIPVNYLVDSWLDELSLYFYQWDADKRFRPYLPVYGEPRPLISCVPDNDDD